VYNTQYQKNGQTGAGTIHVLKNKGLKMGSTIITSCLNFLPTSKRAIKKNKTE